MYGICGKAIDKCARIVYNISVKFTRSARKDASPGKRWLPEMAEEKKTVDAAEEEESATITLVDEDGTEFEFDILASYEQDGVTYLISGFDTGLDAQTMFDMAAELVK